MSERGPYRKRFRCVDCGAPVGRSGARCPDCRKVYKRDWQRAYMHRYHAVHRPPPAPLPQPRGDLPRAGEMIYDDDGARVQCHYCGAFYGSLVTHIRTHGLTAETYKARYRLARGTSLLSPATAEKQRQAALARRQGETYRDQLGPNPRAAGIDNRLQSRVRSSVNSGKRKP